MPAVTPRNPERDMGRAERLAEELHFVGHASAQLAHADDDEVRGFIAQNFAVLRPILADGLKVRSAALMESLRGVNGVERS